MTHFSANLGFLWNDRPPPAAIRAAAASGFDAVECHWPYETDPTDVKAALAETGLRMLGLNTRRGDVSAGENGVAAIPGREAEAKAYIDEALAYAAAIDCGAVHVMAGKTDGSDAAEATFVANLRYAAGAAAAAGRDILIEPLNRRDAPGYHLQTVDHGLRTLDAVGAPNAKLMFDCYHVQIMQGDLIRRLEAAIDRIGHIQIAGVPARGEPDVGEVNYPAVLDALSALGWDKPIGAEYRPQKGSVEAGLGWLAAWRARG